METKTYFANSVSAAMATARRELGAEALLVDSKPAAAAARQFGPLEVTFARTGSGGGLEEIRRELAALRAQAALLRDHVGGYDKENKELRDRLNSKTAEAEVVRRQLAEERGRARP